MRIRVGTEIALWQRMNQLGGLRLPISSLVLGTAMLASSGVAQAQEARRQPREIQGHVQLDTFFFGGDARRATGFHDTFNWANLLSGGVDFGEFGARAWLPFAYASGSFDTGAGRFHTDGFMVGNLALEGFYDLQLSDRAQLRFLARLGLPTSTAADNSGASLAAGLSGGVTFWDPRYWPAGVVTPGVGAEFSFREDVYLINAMATADVLIGTRDGGRGAGWSGEAHFHTQLMVEGAYRIGNVIDVGVRAMGALTPTRFRDGDDAGALAIEPFVQTDPELDFPLYSRVGFIFNLDHGNGPTGEDGRLWGFHLTGGVNF